MERDTQNPQSDMLRIHVDVELGEAMLSVLHAAAISRPSLGIEMQMRWEAEAATKMNIAWQTKLFVHEAKQDSPAQSPLRRFVRRLFAWVQQRTSFYRALMNDSLAYDVILLRYSVHDPFLIAFLLRSKRPVALVHHTIERRELLLDGKYIGGFRALLEKVIGSLNNRLAAGQVAVTKEILSSVTYSRTSSQFAFVYPNGIQTNHRELEDERGTVPEFVFIASEFQPWHGLDRLQKSLEKSSAVVRVHIIGKVSESLKLELSSDSRFVIHGLKTSEEIRTIAKSAWLGIASLGMDRNGLTQGSTLKVREYLNIGLPVAADHEDVFPPDWQFFKKFDVHSQSFVEDLLSFAKSVRFSARKDVRNSSKNFIEKEFMLRNIYQNLSTWFENHEDPQPSKHGDLNASRLIVES